MPISINILSIFKRSWADARAMFPAMQWLLLGWIGVWVVTEILVFSFSPNPGRPLWIVFHLGYFWGTAYFEVAMLSLALTEVSGKSISLSAAFSNHGVVLRFLGLKLLFIPAFLAGIALLLLPGLYLSARFGPALFFVIEGKHAVFPALTASSKLTLGYRGRLMGVTLSILILNLAGAAVLGIGLLLTLPMTAFVLARSYTSISEQEHVTA